MNEWLSASGDVVTTEQFIATLIKDGGELHVGSDSHMIAGEWLFATAACIYFEGAGGTFYYRKSREQKSTFNSLYSRLLHETTLSIFAAEEIKLLTNKRVTIHADVALSNSPSAKFRGQLTSYVSGMGFSILTKPDSWASSSIADRKAR